MAHSIKTAGNFVVMKDGMRIAAFADEADKRLFEAAPDLVETLRMVQAQLQLWEDAGVMYDGNFPTIIAQVIAKATKP